MEDDKGNVKYDDGSVFFEIARVINANAYDELCLTAVEN